MQSVQAGNAVQAPMMSLEAAGQLVFEYATRRFKTKSLTNITPHGCFVQSVVCPNKAICSVDDVQDEQPHDQRESRNVSGSPLPEGGDQEKKGSNESASG